MFYQNLHWTFAEFRFIELFKLLNFWSAKNDKKYFKSYSYRTEKTLFYFFLFLMWYQLHKFSENMSQDDRP